MKEAVGEGSMTLVTMLLVAGAIVLAAGIIGTLLANQKARTKCDNAGYTWTDGKCVDYHGANVDTDNL